MSIIEKNLDLIKIFLKINFKRMKYFGFNTFVDLITNSFYILMNILFWQTIYSNNLSISWNFNDLLVFLAFSELFFAFKNGFFSSTTKFWNIIISGKLDVYLVRPVNPIFRVIIANLNLMEFFKGLLLFIILLFFSSVKVRPFFLFIGLLMCFIATLIFSIIELMFSYLAFKFGKIELVFELIDSMIRFNKYPLNILPKLLYYIFIFIMPFAFISTFPALITIGKIKAIKAVGILVLSVVLAGVWCYLNNMLWEGGLKRYESYNG
ncbi:MAG: ABC-2 family transporter protein [bacterium]|nr:ABC-2 family transporter protein [bacterium]